MVAQLPQARTLRNHLLSSLTEELVHSLLPMLDMVESRLEELLYQQGELIEYVYFPCDSTYSVIRLMGDGSLIEVGTFGNESFTGIELLLDASHAAETVVCQIPGHSLRMQTADFKQVMETQPEFVHMLQHGVHEYMMQISRSMGCNKVHTPEERLGRWLLISHDRAGRNEFALSQESMAAMLGIHRSGISLVAGTFQKAGVIHYDRGQMTILDRSMLEDASCECYAIARRRHK